MTQFSNSHELDGVKNKENLLWLILTHYDLHSLKLSDSVKYYWPILGLRLIVSITQDVYPLLGGLL